jgi:hypothetical protein
MKFIKLDKRLAAMLVYGNGVEFSDPSVSLGIPLPVMEIRTEDLPIYKKTRNLSDIFKHTHEYIYPVVADGKTMSAIAVTRDLNGKWHFALGGIAAPLAVERLKLSSPFVLRVVSTYRWFLATRTGDEVFLYSLLSQGARKGGEREAPFWGNREDSRDVLSRLLEYSERTTRAPSSESLHVLQE